MSISLLKELQTSDLVDILRISPFKFGSIHLIFYSINTPKNSDSFIDGQQPFTQCRGILQHPTKNYDNGEFMFCHLRGTGRAAVPYST